MSRIFSGRVILYCLSLLMIDLTVGPMLHIGPARFFLTYLIILYVAFEWSWQYTVPMAVIIGIARDLVGAQFLGIETFSLVFTALLLDIVVQKIEREILIIRIVITFVFVFCVLMINLILTSFFSEMMEISWYHLSVAMGSSVYTAAVMPVFFYLTSRLFHDRVMIKQYELFR